MSKHKHSSVHHDLLRSTVLAAAYSEKASFSLLENIFQHITDGVIITDEKLTIIDVNPGFTTITGHEKETILGKKAYLLSTDYQEESFYNEIWASIDLSGQWEGRICIRKNSGDIINESLRIYKIYDSTHRKNYLVCILSNLSTKDLSAQDKNQLAFYDTLTKLPNRELFFENLISEINRSERLKFADQTPELIGMIFIDINNFKPINDSYGHLVGDKYLVHIAEILKACHRRTDTITRFGGDEFMILCSQIKCRENMALICERIIEKFTQTFIIEDHSFTVSASFGICLYPDDATTPESLIRKADTAMYFAKKSKKDNNFCYYDELE